jgi:hypothetical protein
MDLITLSNIKHQLQIESTYTDDDQYLTGLTSVATAMVINHLGTGFTATYTGTTSTWPDPVQQAVILLVNHLYLTRSIVSFAEGKKIPMTFEFLLNNYRDMLIC